MDFLYNGKRCNRFNVENASIVVLSLILLWCNLIIITDAEPMIIEDELNETENCRYRNRPPSSLFIYTYFADWGCYDYTRHDLFIGGRLQIRPCPVVENSSLPIPQHIVPGIEVTKNLCIPFNHETHEIQQLVKQSFQNPLIYERWLRCCIDAEYCCKNVLNNKEENKDSCPAIWDGWSCIKSTSTNTIRTQVCSPYSYSRQPPRCNHFSHKECYKNATWNDQTDYSTCSITPRIIFRTRWHISMLSISIIVCFPAMLILIFYNGLHAQKLQLIRNLIIILILRNILVLITQSTIVLDELTGIDDTIMSFNDWPCKLLAFFEKLTTNGIFACMLIEGIYLHQLLTNVFRSRDENYGRKMIKFYVIAGGISILSALAWAIAMATNSSEHCWLVTDDNQFHWINDVPRLIMLITCCVLLSHILFTLWKTFRKTECEEPAALRTARALLICMPIFGIPFIFFIVHPNTTSCTAEQIYYLFYYIFEGFQGVAIAISHCYTDKEVQKYCRRQYLNITESITSKWRKSFDKTNKSINISKPDAWTGIDRRGTVSTIAEKRDSTSRHDNMANNQLYDDSLGKKNEIGIIDIPDGINKLETVAECSEFISDIDETVVAINKNLNYSIIDGK